MNEIKKSSVFSWLLFDLANTVYAFVIPGLYFSVWLVSEQGWTDQALGFATSGAMVIVALTGPWVGARSDGFLIFSLPTFFFVKEKKLTSVKSEIKLSESLVIVIKSWKHSRQYKGLTRFLVGRFFYADAINTLISGLLAVYLVEEAGLTPEDSQGILAIAIVVSIIGGYVFGRAADVYGPRILTLISLICWMVSLSLAIIATEFDQLWLIYVTGVLGGFNIGGIFAVDRVFMTRLSPEKHLGEFYGLYSTVGRFATILGPLLWGFIVNTLELGRNTAMFSLIILLAISFYIIKGVSDNQ